MHKNSLPPKVSVGLPVYNGERYLAEAIESILAQTYENFELIISDNASTDRTEEICRQYAECDGRVRYYRQPVNLGAASNFNRVFELSKGSKYFKWAAHDDWIAPTYLEECVDALENEPDGVLCQSLVDFVDAEGRHLETYDHTVANRRCVKVFGLIRSDGLASTSLMGSHFGGDRTLLFELGMSGRSLLVPQRLFFNRDHDERYRRRVMLGCPPHEELVWWSGPRAGEQAAWQAWPMWALYGSFFRIIHNRVGSRRERIRRYVRVLRSVPWRTWLLFMLEPVIALDPRFFRAFMKLKSLARRRAHSSTNASADSASHAN